MLIKHDELLLRDLKLQPLWLLCIRGGFLVALGAEKRVTRRIRSAALQAVRGL